MPTDGNYVTLQEIRDEGVTAEDATDAFVYSKILQAERFIESNTNRWFYKKIGATITLDGGDSYFWLMGFEESTDMLFLPIPIINLTSVTIDGSIRILSNFLAFTRIGPPVDDRWNPRIASKLCEWPKEGVLNIVIAGDFGFVEETTSGTVPELIRIAARKLTIRFIDSKKMTGAEATARQMELNQSNIVEEKLPGYSHRLKAESLRKFSPVYIGDSEIDDTIDFYRYKRWTVAV
jgi:hypothetical protein